MPGAKPERLIADGQRNFPCRSDANSPEELFEQLPGSASEWQLRSSAWSLRRTAAPAGSWLHLGTNCLARRSTASVVKTRPRRDDADFFMRALDYTRHTHTLCNLPLIKMPCFYFARICRNGSSFNASPDSSDPFRAMSAKLFRGRSSVAGPAG